MTKSSIANPGNKEDLAAVLDAAADTPVLAKRRSASDPKDRRDSYFIRQLAADDNDTTIKYHTKAPEQPESLKKIKYRDVLQHLEALLDYEHKYRIKLPHKPVLHGSDSEPIQHQPQAVPQFVPISDSHLPVHHLYSFYPTRNDHVSNNVQRFSVQRYQSTYCLQH